MLKIRGLFAAVGILSAAAVGATPISGSSLQTELTGLGATVNVQTDQSVPDWEWLVGATGVAVARIELEASAYASGNIFGLYDVNDPTKKLTLFGGANGVGDLGFVFDPAAGNFCTATLVNIGSPTCMAFSSNKFGFFLTNPVGNTFYSSTPLNGDGVDHMVAFEGGPTRGTLNGSPWLAGEYILGWEDLNGGGDRDYDDFVVLVESVVAVPENMSIAFLTLSLLGGLLLQRRRLVNSARTK